MCQESGTMFCVEKEGKSCVSRDWPLAVCLKSGTELCSATLNKISYPYLQQNGSTLLERDHKIRHECSTHLQANVVLVPKTSLEKETKALKAQLKH